jgi:PQQ-like domain
MRAIIWFLTTVLASSAVVPHSGTYLGDGSRNFYGDRAPSFLKVVWKIPLGSAPTMLAGKPVVWSGSGWTGQPLVIREDGELFLIHGGLDHHLRKIRADDGSVVWQTDLGDAIKGTPTFWDRGAGEPESRYVLICGSRRGVNADFANGPAFSLRGVSFVTGKILWELDSVRTNSNSRDVDASAVVLGDKACVPLENGFLTFLSPDVDRAAPGVANPSPHILKQHLLHSEADYPVYQAELSTEASPTLLGGKVCLPCGTGRVAAFSTSWPWKEAWRVETGGDLNSTMPVTNDGCLLLGIEDQFIPGEGGVMKIKPGGGIVWFYPTEETDFYEWKGGLVGSVSVNHRTAKSVSPDLACFAGVDGTLTLIDHKKPQPGVLAPSPREDRELPMPLVLDSAILPSGSISTPLFIDDRIIIGHDKGIELYQVSTENKLVWMDSLNGPMFDSTPVVWEGRVYAGSKDGFLYCLGDPPAATPVEP